MTKRGNRNGRNLAGKAKMRPLTRPKDPATIATEELNEVEAIWKTLLTLVKPLNWKMASTVLVRFAAMCWIRGGGDVTAFVDTARHWALDYERNPKGMKQPWLKKSKN